MIDTHLTIINTDRSYDHHIFKNTLIHIDCFKSIIFKLPNGKLFNGKIYNLSYKDNKSYNYIAEIPTIINLSNKLKSNFNIDIYGLSLETPIISNILFDTGSNELIIPEKCFTTDISKQYPIIAKNVSDAWNNIGYLRSGPISLKSNNNKLITVNTKIHAIQYTPYDKKNYIKCVSDYHAFPIFGVFNVPNDNSFNYLYNLIKDGKYNYYEINSYKLLLYSNHTSTNKHEISLNTSAIYNKTLYVDISAITINNKSTPIATLKEYMPNFCAHLDSGSPSPFWLLPTNIYNAIDASQSTYLGKNSKEIIGTIEIIFNSNYKYIYESSGIAKTYIFDKNNPPDYSNPGINLGFSFFRDNALIVGYENNKTKIYLNDIRKHPGPGPTPSPTPDPSPTGQCHAISPQVSDEWCNRNCHNKPPYCPQALCKCN